MDLKNLLLTEMVIWQQEFVFILKKIIENANADDFHIRREEAVVFVRCPSKAWALEIKKEFFRVARKVEQLSLSVRVAGPGGQGWEIPLWMFIEPHLSVIDENIDENTEQHYLDWIANRQCELMLTLKKSITNKDFSRCQISRKKSSIFVDCPSQTIALAVKREIFEEAQKVEKVPLWAIMSWPGGKSYEKISWMVFPSKQSAMGQNSELFELPEWPPELEGAKIKISPHGLVLESRGKIGFHKPMKVSRKAEVFLELLAEQWGEVCLKWEGGFKNFGKNIIFPDYFLEKGVKPMSESDALINPEKFDELVKTQRIFGSAMTGIDKPLLKALEKMVKSQYPCNLTTLSPTNPKQLWINDKQLETGLEISLEEGIGRNTSIFWRSQDLEEIVKQISIEGAFDYLGPSIIFPPQWGEFDIHFERVDSAIGTFKLAINRSFRPITPPAGIVAT